ncbi:MAG TPA: hypothetical protein VFG10_04720 [Saprospiraceae bacterium]|nr:hypothetical protein [Saprospiraceae bacterium]
MMNLKIIPAIILSGFFPLFISAQNSMPDTVVIELASSSKVTFTMQNKSDLEQLKQYDYQALFDDILLKLENNTASDANVTTTTPATPPVEQVYDQKPQTSSEYDHADRDDEEDEEEYDDDRDRAIERFPNTRHFFNGDLGMNNYFENGTIQTPGNALYTVHPWGSWYVGLNVVQRTRFSRHFSLEGSLGISWNNFKFDENNTLITKNEDGVSFELDTRELNFTKSKLTVSYLSAALVPMFNTLNHQKGYECERYRYNGFRIGVGPYVGYRLMSYSKQQFEVDGDTRFDRERNNFYLQNLRYGLRLQIGVNAVDFFFNYDLNELFEEGKGPGLNAYSFGLIF